MQQCRYEPNPVLAERLRAKVTDVGCTRTRTHTHAHTRVRRTYTHTRATQTCKHTRAMHAHAHAHTHAVEPPLGITRAAPTWFEFGPLWYSGYSQVAAFGFADRVSIRQAAASTAAGAKLGAQPQARAHTHARKRTCARGSAQRTLVRLWMMAPR